ncbi:MAG: hypothetical protein ABIW94_08600 [Gemmatimonadaceae bacterium]
MKSTNLSDLAYLEGWKNPQTVLTVYQQPEWKCSGKRLRAARNCERQADSGAIGHLESTPLSEREIPPKS